MLIPIKDLVHIWKVKPDSVLHVGAHMAEEESEYRKHAWGPVTWIEAQPQLASELKEKLDPINNLVIEAAVWEKSGIEFDLKIASNSQSTSLLDFGTHSKTYPDITYVDNIKVKTVTLEEILPKNIHLDFMNLDIQGAELQALKGIGPRLTRVRWIYSEINSEEVYKSCTTLPELEAFLQDRGFIRLCTKWDHCKTWGDALFGRKEDYTKLEITKMRFFQFVKFSYGEFTTKVKRKIDNLFNK